VAVSFFFPHLIYCVLKYPSKKNPFLIQKPIPTIGTLEIEVVITREDEKVSEI
jgi:hypothetical protein